MKLSKILLSCLFLIATASSAQEQVFVAGDIAQGSADSQYTARILDANPEGIVVTLGDNAYPDGSITDFMLKYHLTWGRHVARTYPSPGNHEYIQPQGAGYDEYFRPRVGHPIGVIDKHWYSYNVGAWHFVNLNTSRDLYEGSEQLTWLKADLEANPRTCVAVIGHYPRFSSTYSYTNLSTMWQVLYDHGVDLYLAGHLHNYERFAKQNAAGQADDKGPVQFVVGTGGAVIHSFETILPNSVARHSVPGGYGVVKFTLQPDRYTWDFLPIAGGPAFTDTGTFLCSGATPASCGIGPELALILPLIFFRKRHVL